MAPSQWNEKLKKSSQTNIDSDKYSLEVSGEFLILLKSNLNKVNISGVRKDIGKYEEHEDVLHLSSTSVNTQSQGSVSRKSFYSTMSNINVTCRFRQDKK